MDNALGGLASLAIAIFASVLLGLASVMIIHRMIDGEFPFLPGIIALFVSFLLIALAVSSPVPAVPAIIFVVVLASMALFPFAAEELGKADLRQFDTERLIKAYNAYVARPDNVSAVFEVSKLLYAHGMKANAIGIATAALNSLSQQADSVSNRSLRDIFRAEEQMLKNWNREAAANPSIMRPIPCAQCGHVNPLEVLVCEQCGTPYLVAMADKSTKGSTVYGRLLITFAILSAVIVGAAAIGFMFSGLIALVLIVAVLAGAGLVIHKMFNWPGRV